MDRLTSMAVFIKVAEKGSFSSAAEAVNISPQMVAKHIVALEERLGTTLITRTTRRQSLTEVGRAYYNRCRLILSEVEAADSLAYSLQNLPKGALRVNAPPLYGAYNLSPLIPGYLSVYPDVRLELTLNERTVDLVEEGYEVVIRTGDPVDISLIARALPPFKLIACASPKYIRNRGMPQTPSDLEKHDCLPVTTGAPGTPHIWQFSKAGKTEEISVTGRLCSNEWRALMHTAINGGVILGPESVLAAEVRQGHLTQVLAQYETPSRPVNILYPVSRGLSAKVQSFVDYVMKEMT
ncbi:LysR family transcriptional regulator [Candidatus Pantoea bituminis]|uniref:LysR family transcriptional regulator n=1 Tax=Candidatus Pantoea bituminis TaxID=2831036 RepID=UPI001C06286E|nr:LysR family transcriptional regulator [Pantoea bituminis]